jgi:hypothetical protein
MVSGAAKRLALSILFYAILIRISRPRNAPAEIHPELNGSARLLTDGAPD